ncbi:MAG TPA: hypothetical protein VF894_11715 [Anaeromyxobacter sp.]
MLVDPCGEAAKLLALREPGGFTVRRIFCTHGHPDRDQGDDGRFYPGHGPAGLVGDERRLNPFAGEPARRGRFP